MNKTQLEKMVSNGDTIRIIARKTGKAYTTVRYWLKKHDIKPAHSRKGVRTWTDEAMREAIQQSETIADVLRVLGLKVRPGNYETVRKYVRNNEIDTTHMLGKKVRRGGMAKKPLSKILVKNSNFSRNHLKERLLKEGILENKCDICGLENEWNDISIKMVFDHINGDTYDNRLKSDITDISLYAPRGVVVAIHPRLALDYYLEKK